MSGFEDRITNYLEAMTDEERREFEIEREKIKLAVQTPCSFGCCMDLITPDRQIIGGWGPIGCPCGSGSGGKSSHPEQRARPRVSVLPRGRNGGRIQRSIKRDKERKANLAYLRKFTSLHLGDESV